MTFGSRFRRHSGVSASRMSLVVALLLCTLFVSATGANAIAQDATPEASPAAAACVAPDVPEGTPEPMDEMMGMDMASPEASPAVEEAAPTPPTGTLVEDQAVIDEATATVNNIWACVNEGNYLGAAALTTANYRLTEFGTENLYTVAALLEQFELSGTVQEVLNVYQYDDGSVGVDYQIISGIQVSRTLDIYVEEDGSWKLDADYDLAPETDLDSQTIGVKFGTADNEFVFEVAPAEFAAEPATIFQATNVGALEHEFVLLQVPEGFDPATITNPQGPPPEGVSFVGAFFLQPGQTGDLLLEGLQPGNYVAYCFLPIGDGTTHADAGMFLPITVTEPVDLGIPDVVGTPAS